MRALVSAVAEARRRPRTPSASTSCSRRRRRRCARRRTARGDRAHRGGARPAAAGARRRDRGALHVPRGAALVRLGRRPDPALRHRRRLARDRGRSRRAARGRGIRPPRRRSHDDRATCRTTRPAKPRSSGCAPTPAGSSRRWPSRSARSPRPDHVVGSSKAIRSLAKLVGYPVPGWSGIERMLLPRASLGSWIPRLARIPASARQELPGNHRRSHLPDRRRGGRAARGDEGDGRRRARGFALGAARRRAASLHRVTLMEHSQRLTCMLENKIRSF